MHLHALPCNVPGRNMLHGPWKEANAPALTLHVDDKNVNGEAIAMALAYLYGHHPKLNDNNAFRVLAAASFLDIQVNILLLSMGLMLANFHSCVHLFTHYYPSM